MAKGTNKPEGIEVKTQADRSMRALASGMIGKKQIVNHEEMFQQYKSALTEIAQEFGFDSKDWNDLARSLALRYHPKLRFFEQKKSGNRAKWNLCLLLCLWADVYEYKRKNPKHGVNAACKHLAVQPFWLEQNVTDNSLNKYYSKEIAKHVDGESFYSQDLEKLYKKRGLEDSNARKNIVSDYAATIKAIEEGAW